MKLSVIVPCHNDAETLSIQLQALAKQEWSEPWEVIFSDNGSSDESREIAKQFQNCLPNFRIIDSSEVRGPAHARNMGAKAATGEALAFCDADDEVAPGWVEAIGDALSKYDFVASRFEVTKLNESWAIRARGDEPQRDGLQPYKYPPYLPHSGGSGLGVKRSIHEAVNGFDETMVALEDTDYCWRIQLMGIELHFVPDATIHCRYRNSLMEMYCQASLWAEYNVLLYKKYQTFGMPRLSKKAGIRRSLKLFKQFPTAICHPEERPGWIWQFGRFSGRLQGSIKYRVFAL
jgi:glycosyltransferase involved in cell wall biosynthesis